MSSSEPAKTAAPAAAGGTTPPKYKFWVTAIFLILNLGISVMMAATGALGVGHATSATDTGNVFVGIYMIMFAAILFTFEVVQIRPCGAVDDFYKKNFGFLYGIIGKGLYIFL